MWRGWTIGTRGEQRKKLVLDLGTSEQTKTLCWHFDVGSVPVKNYLSRGLADFRMDFPGQFLVRRGQLGIRLFETLHCISLSVCLSVESKLSLVYNFWVKGFSYYMCIPFDKTSVRTQKFDLMTLTFDLRYLWELEMLYQNYFITGLQKLEVRGITKSCSAVRSSVCRSKLY